MSVQAYTRPFSLVRCSCLSETKVPLMHFVDWQFRVFYLQNSIPMVP